MLRKTISIIIGILLVAGVAVFGNVFRIHEVVVEYVGGVPTVVDPAEVYAECAVDTDGSILSLNETDVVRRISERYPDRLIVVKDIVREFPNTVKIYIEEHAPICAIPLRNNEGYALADRDFALNRKATEDTLDKSNIIIIKGITVGNTYDTADFRQIRSIFVALEGEGIPAVAQPKMIASITVEVEEFSIELRDGAALKVSRLPAEEIGANAAKAYNEYLATL